MASQTARTTIYAKNTFRHICKGTNGICFMLKHHLSLHELCFFLSFKVHKLDAISTLHFFSHALMLEALWHTTVNKC